MSLVIVAAIHAGIVIGGPFERAAIYEIGVAVVLTLGLALTFGSVFDFGYHLFAIVLLVTGLIGAVRLQSSESTSYSTRQ